MSNRGSIADAVAKERQTSGPMKQGTRKSKSGGLDGRPWGMVCPRGLVIRVFSTFLGVLMCTATVPAADQVRSQTPPALTKLQWMVGSWIHDSEGAVMTMTVNWSENRQLLEREIEIRLGTAPAVRVRQTIYWDPEARKLRSWGLSGDGSTTTGVWKVDGKRICNKCEVFFSRG